MIDRPGKGGRMAEITGILYVRSSHNDSDMESTQLQTIPAGPSLAGFLCSAHDCGACSTIDDSKYAEI